MRRLCIVASSIACSGLLGSGGCAPEDVRRLQDKGEALPIVFTFSGQADPIRGSLEFSPIEIDYAAIPAEHVDAVRAFVTEQTVEADGSAGTGSDDTVELVTVVAARGSDTSLDNCAPLPTGITDCFYADVDIRSFLAGYLGNTYSELTTMSPSTGYEAYNDLEESEFGLRARWGLWRYGTVEPEPGDAGDASDNNPYQALRRRWKFQLPASPRPFAFEGRVMATVYTGTTEAPHLVSATTAGQPSSGNNVEPSTADEGRYVLYREGTQIQRVDRFDGTVVSVAVGFEPRISDDGRYVVYVDDFKDGGSLIRADLQDPNSITTTVIATSTASGPDACSIRDPDMTTDGSVVVFVSDCEAFCSGELGCVPRGEQVRHVYRWRASSAGDCADADIVGVDLRFRESPAVTVYADNDSYQPSVADDGRTVTYVTNATNQLRSADGNRTQDVYYRDICATPLSVPVLVSRGNDNGGQGSRRPDLSADGSTLVFESNDDFDLSEDTNGTADVFTVALADCTDTCPASAVSVVSIDGSTTSAGDSVRPSLSSDGCVSSFTSAATLDPIDTDSDLDVYISDICGTDSPRIASATGFDNEAEGSSRDAVVSSDGQYVVFRSVARNLAEDDGRDFPGTSNSQVYASRTGE